MALLLEQGDGGIGDGNGAHEVGFDDATVFGDVAVTGPAHADDPGVHDDQVDGTEVLELLLQGRRHTGRVAHIQGADLHMRIAVVAQFVRQLLQLFLIAGEQTETIAALGQFTRQGGTDAAGSANNEGGFIGGR
jgi:hypothetical protein